MIVPRETSDRLERLAEMVLDEGTRQNLISASTRDGFWQRHIEDSLQLVPLIAPGVLLDIGSGGGLPGLVLACCRSDPIHLVEPRRKRADFLSATASALSLAHVTVHPCRVERVEGLSARTITARAVARLDELFTMAKHLADKDTRWVLPKGRSVGSELEDARRTWQGRFDLVPSRTDDQSAIVVATGVSRRKS